MATQEICRLLDWDTEFFGFRIARVMPLHLTEPLMHQALDWCQRESIKCLYFLADPDHQESVTLAEQNDFNLVDIRMTFERRLNEQEIVSSAPFPEVSVRQSQLDDLPHLAAIARNIYRDTRFYYDPLFPRERVKALYAKWIEKSCRGYADLVLVAEQNKEQVGYITCHISSRRTGRIGLVGLHQVVQGLGVGQYLVQSALRWFTEHDVEQVEVVTQGRSLKAQRLYQRCHFITQKVQLWYHKWF